MTLATARVNWGTMSEAGAYESRRFPIKDAQQLYEGQLVQLDSGGRLKPYAKDAAGTDGGLILGMVEPTRKDVEEATYLKGNTALSPVPEAIVALGSYNLEAIAVTGAASQADVGKFVYADAVNTAGDHTLTLTATNNGQPFGVVEKWISGTTCAVRSFSYAERRALN